MSRKSDVQRMVDLTGGAARMVDPGDGWPSVAEVQTAVDAKRVAIYGGAFALHSYRGRDELERRMQNPGQEHPVVPLARAIPVILGLWAEGARPVIVAFDAERRFGKTTRQSFFASLSHLSVAAAQGWTSYKSASDEEVFAFWPTMLPAYIEMVARGVRVDPNDMATLVDAAGLSEETAPLPAEERVRRTASTLVRRAAFSDEVVSAYERLCAMCGLDFGLVQGAHIYPASAPGSSDDVRNGIALCANHHAAFDRYLVYVDPRSHAVALHPTLRERRPGVPAWDAFVDTTLPELRPPTKPASRPHPEMFTRRYEYFDEAYAWAG